MERGDIACQERRMRLEVSDDWREEWREGELLHNSVIEHRVSGVSLSIYG
jgi:hypothetical protein